jgi:hypothetical protein
MTSAIRTHTILRRRMALAAAVAVIGLAGAANVRADADPVGLQVVDRNTGQALRTWRHHGRLFVAGEPGARYSLRVSNHTDGRVLLVMSVDGVNILTGETASYDQRGYVLDAYASYDASGWRKSNTEVAAFAFTPLPRSYAARTGRPGDVGVIGMAVFRERAPVPVPFPVTPAIPPNGAEDSQRAFSLFSGGAAARRAMPAPVAAPPTPSLAAPTDSSASAVIASRREEKLGTAHGAREWSVVNFTTFERATPYPQSLQRIEYDTYANLVASGAIPPLTHALRRPRPFPLNPDGAGFAPDPPPEPWEEP